MEKQEKNKTADKANQYCNACGKELHYESGILKEDVFDGVKEWGYFSKRDLEVHKFSICEQCYNEMIEQFVIPVRVSKTKEVL